MTEAERLSVTQLCSGEPPETLAFALRLYSVFRNKDNDEDTSLAKISDIVWSKPEQTIVQKHYCDYMTDTLHALQKRDGRPANGNVNILPRSAGILLDHIKLQDRVRLDDLLAIAKGTAIPDAALQMVLGRAIATTLGIRPEEVRRAWRTDYAHNKPNAMVEVGVGLTPEAARYLCLQKSFIMERNSHQLMQSDVAGMLGIAHPNVSDSERDRGNSAEWARYFQSRRVIDIYAGGSKSQANDLERLSFQAYYPNGLQTAQDLIRFVCLRREESFEAMGNRLAIEHIGHKIKPNSRLKLLPADCQKLRADLIPELTSLAHLDITPAWLDKALPDPAATERTSFAPLLNQWAVLASGKDAYAFAQQVGRVSGQEYLPKKVYEWGKGVGLAAALPHIIHALEINPATRDTFAPHKRDFILLAEQTIPPKAGGNLSSQLAKAPTLGRALNALEGRLTNPLYPDDILAVFQKKYGEHYTAVDYKNWKQGVLPTTPAFPEQLADAICACLQVKSGTWVTLGAREHLRALASGANNTIVPNAGFHSGERRAFISK